MLKNIILDKHPFYYGAMEFINKILRFFRKDEESAEKINMSVNRKAISDHAQKPMVFDRIVELANQEKPEIETKETTAETGEEKPAWEPIAEERIIVPATRGNVNFVNIDVKKLELIRVEREAETITAYSKLLVKNIAHFKEGNEQAELDGVVKKFKMIFVHSMELKNLLSYINESFFEYILSNLTDEQVRKQIEEGKKKTDEIEGLLTKIGSYDDLINPEKSADYKKNIEEIVHKGEFIKEVEQLGKLLMNNVNDKKTGISININKVVARLGEIKKNDNEQEGF